MSAHKQRVRFRVARAISYALPREVRERVFEPALADLILDHQDASTTGPRQRTFASAFLILESLRVGLPAHIWRHGRMTRFGKILAVLILVSGGVVALLSQLPGYAG